jgi:4-hydroxyphenylacetate 3-monooxygenase
LSSRLDENDAIFIFDEVLVPWENVFAYEPEKANNFFAGSGFPPRAMMHGCVRLAVKFDFLCGLLLKGLDMTGTGDFRGVQTRVGELLNYRNLFWTCVDSMVNNPTTWNDGTAVPNVDACNTYRMMSSIAYPRAKEIFQQDLGSALIYQNSNAVDWKNAEMRPFLDKYVRGSGDRSGVDRIKIMKLIWDAIGTEFGGRHELYERNYSGKYRSFVDECLSEYDLNGWTAPDLISSDDVNVIKKRLGQK